MFSKPPQTLRIKLLKHYSYTLTTDTFEPTAISLEQFTAYVCKWLQYANSPYETREKKGLFYSEDYVCHHPTKKDPLNLDLDGLTHPLFWDISTHTCHFIANEGHTPSKALSAFFIGPTFAECATVLQACLYRAIEEMIGTTEFNRVFGTPLSRFMITPTLFAPIYSHEELSEIPLLTRTRNGNPLYFLFDEIDNPTETDVTIGDVVGIQGVENYLKKHPAGAAQAWNLLCIGKNDKGENLYLGFGPKTFKTPLTYDELKLKFIAFYNEDQSPRSKAVIKESICDGHTASSAVDLSKDCVNADYPIGGLRCIIRFNIEKLRHFLRPPLDAWHTLPLDDLKEINNAKSMAASIVQITPFSVESNSKSFSDYQTITPTQSHMLALARKFASAVVLKRKDAIGFAMTGMPGIGKTHLSVSVANYVVQRGAHVIFVDDESIENLYQKMAEERGNPPSMGEMESIFQEWLKKSDLIILDDINSKYGIGANFLRIAIQYVMINNKAIMINANKPLCQIQKNIPDHIGFNDKRTNNFVIMRDLEGNSYRQTWWVASSTFVSTNQEAIQLLTYANNNRAAGILIEEKTIDLEKIQEQYINLSSNKDVKVRIVKEPYKHNHVYDMYIHDAHKHDVFIIQANNTSEYEQLLNLISQVHHLGKKLIVVTLNEKKFIFKFDAMLNCFKFDDKKQRLKDRASNLLLKKSDWHNLRAKPEPFKYMSNSSSYGTLFDKPTMLAAISIDDHPKGCQGDRTDSIHYTV